MKRIIFLFFLIIYLFSCNNYPKKDHQKVFFIIGNANGLIDNTKVFLKKQENKTIILLDSTQIKNGNFTFNGIIDKPSVYGININNIKGQIGLFLKNDTITININKDSLSDSKITGSKLNDQYLNYIKSVNQIISKTNLLYPIFQKARAENDVEKLNEINKKMQAINAEKTTFALNYAKKHPESYIAAFALHSVLNDNSIPKDSVQSIYNRFSNEVKEGDFAIEISIYLENKSILDTIIN